MRIAGPRTARLPLDSELTALSPAGLATKISLVHLDRRLNLEFFREERANLFEHAPCGFVGDASFALDLLGGNPTTRGAHQVHRVEPCTQRCGGLFHDRSGQRVNVPAASFASVGRAVSDAVMLLLCLAGFAVSDTVRPALLFQVFQASIIVRKLAVEVLKLYRRCCGIDCLTAMSSSATIYYAVSVLLSRDNYQHFLCKYPLAFARLLS